MKKYLKFGLLILLVMSLVACSGEEPKQEEKAETEINSLAGKTFYNTLDRFENIDHANVWFGKDGSFVLKDNCLEGSYELYGSYEVKEDVCTLVVEKCTNEKESYEKVIFELKDEETLTLRTSLLGSINGDTFSTSLVEEKTENNNLKEEKTLGYNVGTYINANQKQAGGFGYSTLELKEDGTFVLSDVEGMGATLIEGKYSLMGNVLAFSDFVEKLYNNKGEELFNLEFFIVDENTLQLRQDIAGSKANDYFTISGNLPTSTEVANKQNAKWIHEDIQDVLKNYLPQVKFDDDGHFTFIENTYSSMGEYYGSYQIVDGCYICQVEDSATMQGFAGQDVLTIKLEIKDNYLILRTDLCMSRNGDKFIPNN